MKHILLFTITFFIFERAATQSRFSLRSEAGAGFFFHRFTKDSLVSNSNKGNIHVSGFSYITLLADYKTKNNKWHFLTGLGYMSNSFHMYKEEGYIGLVELFTFAWLWDESTTDPYPYNKVSIKRETIVIPVACMYDVSKQGSAKIQTLVGVRSNFNFIVNKRAEIVFANNNATNEEKTAAQKKFTSLVNPFTVSMMPAISFLGKPGKKIRWDFTFIPIIFYTEGQIQRLYTPERGFNFSIGASYTFK